MVTEDELVVYWVQFVVVSVIKQVIFWEELDRFRLHSKGVFDSEVLLYCHLPI